MAVRTVAVRFTANIAGLAQGTRQAGRMVGDFGRDVQRSARSNEQSINQVTNALGFVGAAGVGAAALAIRAFANFDQAMSNVQAATHESAENMGLLREAALDAGQRTVFSATEAAGAIENLAKAGVSTADILGGGLDGALDLAAAGGLEVADAAEIAATALTQFNLEGSDMTHVADLLAAAAGKAQGDVTDMSFALKQSGLVASQFGLSIEETTGTLAAFASAGLLGSDAGTSFRSMLLHLGNPTAKSATLMKELGIAAYDAQGNFVGMASLAEQLATKLGPLPQAQRDAALATIFGSDAIRAANVLYQQGAEGIDGWIEKVDDQGYAAETAALRLDNLKGDLEQLGGALETALIGMGEGADGPLRSLVQGLTDVVNKFSELPDGAQSALLAIVGGGGLVLLGLAGLGKLIVGIGNTKEALGNLGVTADRTGKAMKTALGVGLVVAAAITLRQVVNDLAESFQEGAVGAGEMELALRQLERGEVGRVIADLTTKFADMKEETGGEWLRDSLLGPFSQGKKEAEEFGRQMEVVDGILAGMVEGGDIAGAAELVADLGRQFGLSGDELEAFVNEHLPGYTDGLAASRAAMLEAGKATGSLGEEFVAVDENIEAATERLEAWLTQLQAATDPVFALSDSLAGVTEAELAFNEALAEHGPESAEAQQASIDLARAVASLEAAALDGELSFEDFDSKLQQWVDSGRISEEAAASLRQRIATLRGEAENYQGTYNANIDEDGAARSEGNIREARREGEKYNGKNWIADIRARAHASDANRIINNAARNRTTTITVRVNRFENQLVAQGGYINGYAAGGYASGGFGGPVRSGTTGSADDVIAYLSRGEFVIRASQTKRHRRLLEAINAGAIPTSLAGFASGGIVGIERDIIRGAVAQIDIGREINTLARAINSVSRTFTGFQKDVENLRRSLPKAPISIGVPSDRPNGKQPLNLTGSFARDLLEAIRSGKRIEEDFAWKGMDPRWSDDNIRRPLIDAFYKTFKGYDFEGFTPDFKGKLIDLLLGYLNGSGGRARMATSSVYGAAISEINGGPARPPLYRPHLQPIPQDKLIDPDRWEHLVRSALSDLKLELRTVDDTVIAREAEKGGQILARRR